MSIMMGVTSTVGIKEVCVPKLFPTHTIREVLLVEKWYVQAGDILQPDQLMVSLETPPGFFDIPAPPEVTVPHRVIRLHAPQGGEIRLNDALITLLESVSEGE